MSISISTEDGTGKYFKNVYTKQQSIGNIEFDSQCFYNGIFSKANVEVIYTC